jgi:diguanylate cyclase (GGDEF)-like protein/PAS domain S-box-containing protein
MKRLLHALDRWLAEGAFELRMWRLLLLGSALVMLVSGVLVVAAVVVWNGRALERQFQVAQSSLSGILNQRVAETQRLVAELAADQSLSMRLDSIDQAYEHVPEGQTEFQADQHAIVLQLARLGPQLRALLVAYDRDGEALAYFDGRDARFAMGRFTSSLFGGDNRASSAFATSGGAEPVRPLARGELSLPVQSEFPDWRYVDGHLTQVAVAPVFARPDGIRRQVGFVAVFVADVVTQLDQAARTAGLSTRWMLPPGVAPDAPDGLNAAARQLPAASVLPLGASGVAARFETAQFMARVFSLLPQSRADGARLILLLDKSGMRIRVVMAFIAAMLVPLLASLLVMPVLKRVLRRHVAGPLLDLSAYAKQLLASPEDELPAEVQAHADELLQLRVVLDGLVAELAMREHGTELWASVFCCRREAIFVSDLGGQVEYINPAFSEISGLKPDDILGRPASFLKAGLHDEVFYQKMWQALDQDGHWSGEVWDQKADGSTYPQWLWLSAVTDRQGKVTHYAGIFNDLSERKEQEERIQYLAHHDTLTGLPNRSLMIERLRVALLHAEREGHQMAVLFIDLDRFKLINDSLGHSVGDGLLQTVAERLKRAVRASDTVSRLGGDEFIVTLYKIRSVDEARGMAENILGVLAPTARVEGNELAITPSIGVAIYPDHGLDADELIRNADVAMYHAKGQGRNNYQLFSSSMSELAEESLSLEHALRSALDHDEFELFYQPQIEIATRKLVGVEALLRWNSREFGEVAPDRFIRIAEESGLILQMGDWVLREACRQRAEWNIAGIQNFPVAVNVSALQFRQPEFVRRVEEGLRLYGVPAAQLELELTESIVMQESSLTANALEKLRQMGVAMCIDDFGTGYSSLGYLKHLPVKKLKVDAAFVRDMESDRADRAIVEAIVSLGRALDLILVAEGVEQRSTLTSLGKLGCHVAQGFYYCRPVPAEEFLTWYREFVGEAPRLSVA